MRRIAFLVAFFFAAAIALPPVLAARPSGPAMPPSHPSIAPFLKPGLPIELVSAAKVDRIAWIAYEEGKRNVFTAIAPAFAPVRVTSFLKDDGIDLTGLRISDDGSTVVFVRGQRAEQRQAGSRIRPRSRRRGARDLGGAQSARRPALRLAEGIEPGGLARRTIRALLKDGQIYRARVERAVPRRRRTTRARSRSSRRGAATAARAGHRTGRYIAFVEQSDGLTASSAIYDIKTRSVSYRRAERRSRHESDVVGGRQDRSRFCAGPGCRSARSRRRARQRIAVTRISADAGRRRRPRGRGARGRAGRSGSSRRARRPGTRPLQRSKRRRRQAAARQGGRGGRGGGGGQPQRRRSEPLLADQPGLYRGQLAGRATRSR